HNLSKTSDTNFAQGGQATQSSTLFDASADVAIDGDTGGNGSVTHTDHDHEAWWSVDLGEVVEIGKIVLWNRTDCCSDRLQNFDVLVSDVPITSHQGAAARAQTGVGSYHHAGSVDSQVTISVNRSGRYIRVQLRERGILSLAEVEVFGFNNGGVEDSDSDGVPDLLDAFPNDGSETSDADQDGTGDNSDAFPNDPNENRDSDSDNVGDNADAFPDDPSEQRDSDADGIGDNSDAFPHDASEHSDADGDGVGDNADRFPNDPNEWADSDNDGIGDNADPTPNGGSGTDTEDNGGSSTNDSGNTSSGGGGGAALYLLLIWVVFWRRVTRAVAQY
ncbi:MAG: discoidin domain-containing protein, partial [Pseudomonadota bacterium]